MSRSVATGWLALSNVIANSGRYSPPAQDIDDPVGHADRAEDLELHSSLLTASRVPRREALILRSRVGARVRLVLHLPQAAARPAPHPAIRTANPGGLFIPRPPDCGGPDAT